MKKAGRLSPELTHTYPKYNLEILFRPITMRVCDNSRKWEPCFEISISQAVSPLKSTGNVQFLLFWTGVELTSGSLQVI